MIAATLEIYVLRPWPKSKRTLFFITNASQVNNELFHPLYSKKERCPEMLMQRHDIPQKLGHEKICSKTDMFLNLRS